MRKPNRRSLTAVLVAGLASLLAIALVGTAPASNGADTVWSPTNGVIISNPRGTTAQKYVIQDRVVKMIDNTPAGESIKMAMWNIESTRVVTALLAAHQRGVTVRVLMDEANREANPEWGRLQTGLKGNDNNSRPVDQRSIAKVCVDTCRGGAGAMHDKVILFSKVGGATDVVMQGAANMTAAIVLRQWTDMATFVNSPDTYNFWNDIYGEMWLDTAVYPQFRDVAIGPNRQMVFPFRGSTTTNRVWPALEYLRKTSCTGVVNSGLSGRTVIRIGIASLRNSLGLSIANRIKTLWNQGCNVRVIYAVMGSDSYKVLRSTSGRGPVPIRHVVSDPNRDGNFDQYLHTKFLMISGKFGTNPSEKLVLMGSPNWSSLSDISDENGAVIRWPGVVKQYWDFADRWYNNPPPYNRVAPATSGARVADPYSQIKKDTSDFAD